MSNLVAHHFDDAEQQLEAATLGMWLFLATEVLFFGGMFAAFFVYRAQYGPAFEEASTHLDVTLGTINTAVLLCSSLTMVLAVHAAQAGEKKKIVGFLVATMLLASVFLGIKVVEYSSKFEHHLVPGTHFHLEHVENEAVNPRNVELYFGFYFAMTGMHALHMIIGIAVMGVLAIFAGRGAYSSEYFTPIEMTGLYWHFVDIVWVFLFPLLYLIG